MATVISIQKCNVIYDLTNEYFFVKGKSVVFDTSYMLKNEKTGRQVQFDFKESTGSEWDPNTIWIYQSKCKSYQLAVGNDDVTPAHAQAYLDRKMKNMPKDDSQYPGGIHPNNLGGDGYAMLHMQNGIES